MGNDSNPKILTGSASTTIGSCLLYGISVNTALAGTLLVKEGATTLASFAIGTVAGTYWIVPNGTRFGNLVFTLSAGDNVTVFTRIQ